MTTMGACGRIRRTERTTSPTEPSSLYAGMMTMSGPGFAVVTAAMPDRGPRCCAGAATARTPSRKSPPAGQRGGVWPARRKVAKCLPIRRQYNLHKLPPGITAALKFRCEPPAGEQAVEVHTIAISGKDRNRRPQPNRKVLDHGIQTVALHIERPRRRS